MDCIAGCCILLALTSCSVPAYELWPRQDATGGFASGGRSVGVGGSGGSGGSASNSSSTLPEAGTSSVKYSDTLGSGGALLAQTTASVGGAPALGGAPAAGGTSSIEQTFAGGTVGSGGSPAVGGSASASSAASGGHTGGVPVNPTLVGGNPAIGGALSVGGTATGGSTSADVTSETHAGGTASNIGGAPAGGQVASGGTISVTGGNSATGGVLGTGGTSNAYCTSFTDLGTFPGKSNNTIDVPIDAICYRFTVSDLMAQVQGVGMYICDTRKGTLNGIDCTTGCTASLPIERAADGYWYLEFSAGKSSSCTAQWWWY